MSELRRYPDYKDSGVPWLGDIPSHWEVWKITHLVERIGSGTTPKSSNYNYYGEEGVLWVTTSELRETVILDTKKKLTEEALQDYSTLKVFPKNSVAIAMYGATIGRLGILGKEATFNQACCVYAESEKINYKFLYYWLWYRRPILISLSNGGGQPNLNQDDLRKLRLSLPPLEEQQAIVNFLDNELDHIDTLIGKQKQLLDKLAEQRSAVITHAVTKGLDPNVPMKDSGVEWLGEIPEHWKATKLKYYFDIQLGKMLQPNSTSSDDFEVDYLKAMHVQWDNVKVIDLPQMWCNERELEKYEVYNGDLLICEGGEVGRSALIRDLEGTTIIQNALHRLRSTNLGDVRYLDYLIRHIADSEWFSTLCNKATIAHLTGDKLANTFITLPPLAEQIKIINYLNSQTQKIDEMSKATTDIITKLQEYRAALITQAVTGKIDVRHLNK